MEPTSPFRPETVSFEQNPAQAPIWGTIPITRAADTVVKLVQPMKQAPGPLGVKRHVSAIIQAKLCPSAAFQDTPGLLGRPRTGSFAG